MQNSIGLNLEDEVDMKKLGQRIRNAREIKKMTQEQLADQCDCVYKHIGAIEKGRKRPSIELLMRISVVLEVSVDSLLKDSANSYIGYWENEEFKPRFEQMTPKTRMALLTIMDQLIEIQQEKPNSK